MYKPMYKSIGPFEKHLREAIELNRIRSHLYAELSNGASLPISRRLICFEQLLLPLAWCLDRKALPYHRAGIPLLEELFVPMSSVPPFRPVRMPTSPQTRVPKQRMCQRLEKVFVAEGYAGAGRSLEKDLLELAAAPCYDCMLRHLLESALHLCRLAPKYLDEAENRGLTSPKGLLNVIFRLHLGGLGLAMQLDAKAQLLQAKGIAILCQDLPPITADLYSHKASYEEGSLL